MELGIGLVYDFPMKALPELRGVRIETKQPHITRPQDSAANSGVALDHGVLMVTVTAGIAIWHIFHNSGKYNGLVLLMQFSNRRGCGCFGLLKYSGPVCAKLRFLGIDVLFRLMVDRGHGILLPLPAALRDSGNGHIMLIPQLFHNLLQPVCRKAAHFHTATAGDSAGREIEVQFRSSSFGVLTVQLKKIPHLVEDYIIRVALLDAVVFPHSRVRLLGLQGIFFRQGLFCLDFVILRLFLFCEIASLLDQVGNPFGDFLPGEMHIRAAVFFVVQTFSVVAFIAFHCTGQGMGVTANTILMFEKIHLFLIRMGFLEKGENSALTALKSAASGHGGVDLVLRDKLLDRRYFRQLRGKGGARQGQILQVLPNFFGFMVVEAQQIPILLVGRPEGSIFFRKVLAKLRAFQLFGEPCRFLRETAPRIVGKDGQIPSFSGFLAEIVVQIPELFREEGAFIARSLSQLHIGGKLAVLQKLADTLSGTLPGNDLGGLIVTGSFAVGKMDSILGIPCSDAANPVAAMIQIFQGVCDLGGGLLFLKGRDNALSLAIGVAAQPQHMVDVSLGKRKSRGCFHILCFIYDSDLFCFGEEETQL